MRQEGRFFFPAAECSPTPPALGPGPWVWQTRLGSALKAPTPLEAEGSWGSMPVRAHLICGGFPAGDHAGHDMDFARLNLLTLLREANALTTTASDYSGLVS